MATMNQVGVGLSGSTGSGTFVGANTPTLITPIIGAATGTSLVVSGNLTAGLGAGGSPGTLISFPTTTAKGRLVIAAVDNATGAFDTTISNDTAVAQAQVITIPDSGASTAKFILSTGTAQTIGAGLSLTAPALGTPASGTLSSCTGYAQSALTGLGTGVSTALGQNVSGSGAILLAGSPVLTSALSTTPAASQASALGLGVAYQNPFGYDVVLTVYLAITSSTTADITLGVGPTNAPSPQTIVAGLTLASLAIIPVNIYLPKSYYALLDTSGTIVIAISGQQALPV